MKAEVYNAKHVHLIPENDADQALLRQWVDGTAYIAGSGYSDGKTDQVTIGFRPIPKTKKKKEK